MYIYFNSQLILTFLMFINTKFCIKLKTILLSSCWPINDALLLTDVDFSDEFVFDEGVFEIFCSPICTCFDGSFFRMAGSQLSDA